MPDVTRPDPDMFDAGIRGYRHGTIRRANERAVLTAIGFNFGLSNAEIARTSGLAPQTVSAILMSLEAEGLVTRGPVVRGKRGQPATPIYLSQNAAFSIGIEIGWQHLHVVLIDFYAQILGERTIAFAYPDPKTVVEMIVETVEHLRVLVPADREGRLQDIGIAMPGRLADNLDLIDTPAEIITQWRETDLVKSLGERTGLEVSIIKDGNAACWAELIALPRPRPANILYFLVSFYVAAGIIGDGVLLEGSSGNGADLGAMLVALDDDGPRPTHGIASIWALGEILRNAGKPHATHERLLWKLDTIEAELDFWIARSAKALARTVYNAATVIDSPLVIIDTVLNSDVSERLAAALREELQGLPTRSFMPPEVSVGRFGRMAPSIGAGELPLFRRYF